MHVKVCEQFNINYRYSKNGFDHVNQNMECSDILDIWYALTYLSEKRNVRMKIKMEHPLKDSPHFCIN